MRCFIHFTNGHAIISPSFHSFIFSRCENTNNSTSSFPTFDTLLWSFILPSVDSLHYKLRKVAPLTSSSYYPFEFSKIFLPFNFYMNVLYILFTHSILKTYTLLLLYMIGSSLYARRYNVLGFGNLFSLQ